MDARPKRSHCSTLRAREIRSDVWDIGARCWHGISRVPNPRWVDVGQHITTIPLHTQPSPSYHNRFHNLVQNQRTSSSGDLGSEHVRSDMCGTLGARPPKNNERTIVCRLLLVVVCVRTIRPTHTKMDGSNDDKTPLVPTNH